MSPSRLWYDSALSLVRLRPVSGTTPVPSLVLFRSVPGPAVPCHPGDRFFFWRPDYVVAGSAVSVAGPGPLRPSVGSVLLSVAGPGLLRSRSGWFLSQIRLISVPGPGAFCCWSAFFAGRATQIGLSALPVSQFSYFLRTCCRTEQDLQHKRERPAAEKGGTCNAAAPDLRPAGEHRGAEPGEEPEWGEPERACPGVAPSGQGARARSKDQDRKTGKGRTGTGRPGKGRTGKGTRDVPGRTGAKGCSGTVRGFFPARLSCALPVAGCAHDWLWSRWCSPRGPSPGG